MTLDIHFLKPTKLQVFVLWMFLFAAQNIDYDVHVLVCDTYYNDVTHIELELMNICLTMAKPFLTKVYLERPCVQC